MGNSFVLFDVSIVISHGKFHCGNRGHTQNTDFPGVKSHFPVGKRSSGTATIVAHTNVSPFARVGNICCGHKFCVRDTKNVSDFVQKHFVSAANLSQFAQPKKHHEQQCVRDNVSSFARAFTKRVPEVVEIRPVDYWPEKYFSG